MGHLPLAPTMRGHQDLPLLEAFAMAGETLSCHKRQAGQGSTILISVPWEWEQEEVMEQAEW